MPVAAGLVLYSMKRWQNDFIHREEGLSIVCFLFKGRGHQMNIFWKDCEIISAFITSAKMAFEFLGCLVKEKNNCKISACHC